MKMILKVEAGREWRTIRAVTFNTEKERAAAREYLNGQRDAWARIAYGDRRLAIFEE